MKKEIESLNKAFENRIRIGIMSVLMVNERVDFNTLKETLDTTDGNLASHLNGLEKLNYVSVKKQFLGKKPNTSYATTAKGRRAFEEHLNALERILKSLK